MKQKNKAVTLHEVRLLFENKFPELLAGAVDSPDEASFRQKIDAYLSDASWNAEGVRVVRRLLEYDGRVIHELSVGELSLIHIYRSRFPPYRHHRELSHAFLHIPLEHCNGV